MLAALSFHTQASSRVSSCIAASAAAFAAHSSTVAVEFRNNVLALARTAKLYDVPTVLTTSLDKGPNGPLMPELTQMFPDAPFIARPGEINAWDNADFVKAVKVCALLVCGVSWQWC